MERLQDSGAMAEAGDDLRSYLSLWQKWEKNTFNKEVQRDGMWKHKLEGK